MLKKRVVVCFIIGFLLMVFLLSQIWHSGENKPYFVNSYKDLNFIYNGDKQPVGIEYQDNNESIYFLKEKDSKAFMNEYDKVYGEYECDYDGYDCEIKLLKSTSLFIYGNKSILIYIKTNDFWIRKKLDGLEFNNSDFEDVNMLKAFCNPYIKEMIDFYESRSNDINETYQKGYEALL